MTTTKSEAQSDCLKINDRLIDAILERREIEPLFKDIVVYLHAEPEHITSQWTLIENVKRAIEVGKSKEHGEYFFNEAVDMPNRDGLVKWCKAWVTIKVGKRGED